MLVTLRVQRLKKLKFLLFPHTLENLNMTHVLTCYIDTFKVKNLVKLQETLKS